MEDIKLLISNLILDANEEIKKTLDGRTIYELLEVPANKDNGDFAFPCFKLASALKKSPAIIASEVAGELELTTFVSKIDAIGPYVNFFASPEWLARTVLSTVLLEKDGYGSNNIGKRKKVIVEFSSPNIAKPFHIGHIRSTVIGNAINNIFRFCGYETIKINHLGDYGTQFGKMIVAYKKWGSEADVKNKPIKSLLSYYTKFHKEAKEDPSLEDDARATFLRLEQGGEEEMTLWQWFRDESLKEFSRVYDMLGVSFDSYAGESFYSDKMDNVLEELKKDGLLKKDQGAQIVDLENYDMPPALITKNDGSTLYITRDIAAAIYRKKHYDFYKNIYVVANQQELHFRQWFKVLDLMGYSWAKDCIHIPFGLVHLEDGVMSTREGKVVFLEEVLEAAVEKTKEIIMTKGVAVDILDSVSKSVGIGAVVFNELAHNRIKDYMFSFDKVLSFEGETGPYVQYSFARAASLLARAEGFNEAGFSNDDIAYAELGSPTANALIKDIYAFPEIIKDAHEKLEPSVVARHIVDIAQSFNKFYHDEHILVEDEKARAAKLFLVAATKQVLKNGLTLLGIDTPERM
jgi:arginyl-tRNA synthetase